MTFKAEFQAVVLAAGKGSRMSEITAEQPKCLLPVGPKPLVWYPLQKLEKAGFKDVILVVLQSQRSEIQATLEQTDLEINIEYFAIEENENDSEEDDELKDVGTAESLRMIHDKLKSDVLILSCDFVTDIDLKSVINMFRMYNASIVSLLMQPEKNGNLVVPGPKSKHKPERDLIGIDQQTNRMVFLASASDFETDLKLPTSLLKKHTNLKIYSNLIDSHVYVLKNWVIRYLRTQENLLSIKGELLPHIVKKQLSRPPKPTNTKGSMVTAKDAADLLSFAKEDDLDVEIRETSAFNDHFGDLKGAYHDDHIRCYGFIAPKETFGVRVNTLPAYWSINAKIIDKWQSITNGMELNLKNPAAQIDSNQVDNKCIVWEGAKLKEKTSFKSSIIGTNTDVCSFTRVFNSIVMNNVTIKEKVVLENSIVCDGATIESGCQIKGCIIGSHHSVPADSEHSNEVLTETDRLIELNL